jgi:hypothetical protein
MHYKRLRAANFLYYLLYRIEVRKMKEWTIEMQKSEPTQWCELAFFNYRLKRNYVLAFAARRADKRDLVRAALLEVKTPFLTPLSIKL